MHGMRVCILGEFKGWGGTEVHTLGLVDALMKRGHDVIIVCLENGHVYERISLMWNGRVRVISAQLPVAVDEMSFKAWYSAFTNWKAEVCVLVKGRTDVGSFGLDLAARLRIPRYVTIEHSPFPPVPVKSSRWHCGGLVPGVGLWWYRQVLARRLLRVLCPTTVVCVSNAVKEVVTVNDRLFAGKVLVVRNGVDVHRYRPNPEKGKSVREFLGIPADAFVFGAVGRLSKEKDYGLAIDLFAELVASHQFPPMRLVLVGDGPEEEYLRDAAKRKHCDGLIIFMGASDRAWDVYCAFDVFLLPSVLEGLPLTLLEGMACGCCPIAMEVGGVPEVITNSRLGWLVAPRNRMGFLLAMREALETSAQDRAEMGKNARDHMIEHHSAGEQFSELVSIIEGRGSSSEPRNAKRHRKRPSGLSRGGRRPGRRFQSHPVEEGTATRH